MAGAVFALVSSNHSARRSAASFLLHFRELASASSSPPHAPPPRPPAPPARRPAAPARRASSDPPVGRAAAAARRLRRLHVLELPALAHSRRRGAKAPSRARPHAPPARRAAAPRRGACGNLPVDRHGRRGGGERLRKLARRRCSSQWSMQQAGKAPREPATRVIACAARCCTLAPAAANALRARARARAHARLPREFSPDAHVDSALHTNLPAGGACCRGRARDERARGQHHATMHVHVLAARCAAQSLRHLLVSVRSIGLRRQDAAAAAARPSPRRAASSPSCCGAQCARRRGRAAARARRLASSSQRCTAAVDCTVSPDHLTHSPRECMSFQKQSAPCSGACTSPAASRCAALRRAARSRAAETRRSAARRRRAGDRSGRAFAPAEEQRRPPRAAGSGEGCASTLRRRARARGGRRGDERAGAPRGSIMRGSGSETKNSRTCTLLRRPARD